MLIAYQENIRAFINIISRQFTYSCLEIWEKCFCADQYFGKEIRVLNKTIYGVIYNYVFPYVDNWFKLGERHNDTRKKPVCRPLICW